MSPTLAFLPSPLLGPAAWQPVRDLLAARGWAVATLPAYGRILSYRDVLDTWELALPPDGRYVVVPHSNAGLYVPALGERRHVVGQVFVDAGLPPATGSAPLAEPAHYRSLVELADGTGMLPPWTGWWKEEDLARLFPNAETRAGVEAEQGRLPLSYFAGRMPVAAGWTDRPSAYLAFGDTYAKDRRVAEERAWPVRTLPGGHLLMLMEPELVASALDDMLDRMGLSA